MEIVSRAKWAHHSEIKAASRAINHLSGLNFRGLFPTYDRDNGLIQLYSIIDNVLVHSIGGIKSDKSSAEDPNFSWKSDKTLACLFSDSIFLIHFKDTGTTSKPTYTTNRIPLQREYTAISLVNDKLLILWSNAGFCTLNPSNQQIEFSISCKTSFLLPVLEENSDSYTLWHANDRILSIYTIQGVCLSAVICDSPIEFMDCKYPGSVFSLGMSKTMVLPNPNEANKIETESIMSSLFSVGINQNQFQSPDCMLTGGIFDSTLGKQLTSLQWPERESEFPVSISNTSANNAGNMIVFSDRHRPIVYIWDPTSGQEQEMDLKKMSLSPPSCRVLGSSFVMKHVDSSDPNLARDFMLYLLIGEKPTDPFNLLLPGVSHFENLELLVVDVDVASLKSDANDGFMAQFKDQLFQLALGEVNTEISSPAEITVKHTSENDLITKMMLSIDTMNRKMEEMVSSQNRIEAKLDSLSERMSQLEKRQ